MNQSQRQTSNDQKADAQDLSGVTASGRAIALSSIDLAPVMERIKEHNQEVGPGLTLARLFIELMQQARNTPRSEFDPSARFKEALSSEDALRAARREAIDTDLGPTLLVTGLSIGLLGKGWGISGSETDFRSHRLACHVNDAAKFQLYLESLDPGSITKSQKEGLISLLDSLRVQLRNEYNTKQPDDRLLSLVRVAEPLVRNFERLGLSAQRFKRYVDAIQGRYLRDLVQAEELQLDTPFTRGQGATLKWHRDCAPATLKQNWDSVLDTLLTLSQSPTAEKLYRQARETAHAAASSAIAEVSAWPTDMAYSYYDRREEFLTILKRVELRLTDF